MRKFLITILVVGLAVGFYVTKVRGGDVTAHGPIIELTYISTAWTYTESSDLYGDGTGVRLKGFAFYPSTGDTGDVLIVRNGSATGPRLCILRTIDYTDSRYVDLGGAKIKPVIVYSECSLSTGHLLVFFRQQ